MFLKLVLSRKQKSCQTLMLKDRKIFNVELCFGTRCQLYHGILPPCFEAYTCENHTSGAVDESVMGTKTNHKESRKCTSVAQLQ